jgi:hypothetical protein
MDTSISASPRPPLLLSLRETNVFGVCNAVAMVPSIAEKVVPSSDKIYSRHLRAAETPVPDCEALETVLHRVFLRPVRTLASLRTDAWTHYV